MPINSLFKLSELDGFLDDHLGDLQNSRVVRHNLRRSPDLKTYTSPRYGNWNVGRGVTIFVNKIPVLSDDHRYTMQTAREELTVFDADGNKTKTAFVTNPSGAVVFDQPLKPTDEVEADFSFRMVSGKKLSQELYHGLLDVQRRMYREFDPAQVPSVVVDMIIDAALMHFYTSMNSEASLLYDYKIQEQSHSKSQIGKGLRDTLDGLEQTLQKKTKQALWQIGNGRARKVTSLKQHYEPSSALLGYHGPNMDGV
jgi:hypothetical protein